MSDSDASSDQDVTYPSNQSMGSQTPNNDRLPPELLGQIFLHGDYPIYPMMDTDDGPVSCWTYPPFQVCSSWRRAARGTAALFTQFSLGASITSRSNFSSESLNVWLQFSGNLNIKISFAGDINKHARSHLPSLLDHIHRWSSFKLINHSVPTESLNALWAALSKAHHLEHLFMIPEKRSGHYGARFLLNEDLVSGPEIFLPRLKTLSVYNIRCIPAIRGEEGISLELDNVNVATFASIHGVTSLSVGQISGDLASLPASYNIRRLSIIWDTDRPIIAKILALSPNIEYLELRLNISPIDDSILEWENTASVRELWLICGDSGLRYDTNEDEVDELKSEPVTKIGNLLQKFPSLESLVVEWEATGNFPWRIPKEFSKVLGEKESDGEWTVCPELEEFTVTKMMFISSPSKIKEVQDILKDRVEDGLEFDWEL